MAGNDDCQWFHGKITRENALNILSAHGKKEGVFLVRESKTVPGDLVLSLWHDNQALHFQIQNRGGIFFSIDDGPVFQGLDSLIDYYRNDADGLPIRLTSYCQGGPPPSSIRKRGVQTRLHNACSDGNSSLVRKLLKENPSDVNARNEHGATPLHEASVRGIDGVVSLLLKAGADVKSRDNSGLTPLQNACAGGHASTCAVLVQQGQADMQERCTENGWVPLHEAAARGHENCVETLIELGAPLHPRTTDGDIPRDLALRYGHYQIVELIDNFPVSPPKTSPLLWLHENLDRKGAVTELNRWGAMDGLFLVRLSTREHGYYVLSLALNKQIFHYQIRSRADRFFYIDDGPLFETLPHIIEYYSKSADGLPVLLKMAVPPTGNPPVNISYRSPMPGGWSAHTGKPATPPATPAKTSPALSPSSSPIPKPHGKMIRSGSADNLLNGQKAPHPPQPRRVSSPAFTRSISEAGTPRSGPEALDDYNKLEEWTGDYPPPPAIPPPRASRRPPPPLPPPTPPREPIPPPTASPPPQVTPMPAPRAVTAGPTVPVKSPQTAKTAQQTLINRDSLELGPELGQGEFGSVLKGIWRNPKGTKISVALKTLHPEKIAHGEQEFLREARVMYGLDHPCIVQLIGVCLGPPLILVQELVAMGALLDFLIDHPSEINQRDLKLWAAQIAWGMTYLEKKRFVHRDLATRNILMASKSQLKISDFGLSRAVGTGSDYYRASQGGRWPVKWYAPESINYGTFSHKSDVWSYGVTLWEMYSFGQLPYGEMTGAEVIRMLEEEGKRLGRPEGCPEHTYSLMLQCWDLSAEKRPTFAELHNVFSTNPLYSDVKLPQRDRAEKT